MKQIQRRCNYCVSSLFTTSHWGKGHNVSQMNYKGQQVTEVQSPKDGNTPALYNGLLSHHFPNTLKWTGSRKAQGSDLRRQLNLEYHECIWYQKRKRWVKSCTSGRYRGCKRWMKNRTLDGNVSNMLDGTDSVQWAQWRAQSKWCVPVTLPRWMSNKTQEQKYRVDSPAATGCKGSRNTESRLFTKCHLM